MECLLPMRSVPHGWAALGWRGLDIGFEATVEATLDALADHLEEALDVGRLAGCRALIPVFPVRGDLPCN